MPRDVRALDAALDRHGATLYGNVAAQNRPLATKTKFNLPLRDFFGPIAGFTLAHH